MHRELDATRMAMRRMDPELRTKHLRVFVTNTMKKLMQEERGGRGPREGRGDGPARGEGRRGGDGRNGEGPRGEDDN